MIFLNTALAASPRYRETEPVGYSLTILSPTEGEEVSSDFTMTVTDNQNSVTINLTEGQEVNSDFTGTFE